MFDGIVVRVAEAHVYSRHIIIHSFNFTPHCDLH